MAPKSVIVNTGDQHEIQHIIDGFFEERVCDLTRIGFERNLFQIKSGEIAYHDNTITDDRVTSLLYGDRIAAVVLETRTFGNRIRYDFFENCLKDI